MLVVKQMLQVKLLNEKIDKTAVFETGNISERLGEYFITYARYKIFRPSL